MMIIKAIKITPEVAIKIYEKHDVQQAEIEDALRNDNSQFWRVGGDQYAAIGLSRSRYVTIYFEYDEKTKEAEITTAYPSSKGQIKSYKRIK